MNMQNDNIVYWRKNQVALVVNTNTPLEPHVLLNPELDPVWTNIRAAFKGDVVAPEALSNLDLNHMRTFVYPSSRVYFARCTPPEQGNADLSGIDYTFGVLKKLEDVKEKSGHDYSVMPNWLNSGVDNTHGCPVGPPFPVKRLEGRGRYTINLQELPDNLQSAKGKNVTVFVLDTLPPINQVKTAADKADDYNMLLKEMVVGMKDTEPNNVVNASPPAIKLNYSFNDIIPAPTDSAKTGKDIYGRLVGFPMEDHGLAIAGILRDLAPQATIECIRVLNDYGVGDLHTLLLALDYIYKLILKHDESLKLPVVINMSLVWLPPEHDIHDGSLPGIEDIIARSKEIFHSILTQPGFDAIFVASSGNDSDPRDAMMNPSEVRFSPRYPAAFADDEKYKMDTMIPVGAVNKDKKAASYSNYPGQSGIATYGGELPKPRPWLPGALSHAKTHVDAASVDAIRGIYTAEEYPALSVNDEKSGNQEGNAPQGMSMEYPMYPAPNTRAWAYWSGTSYAAPIISALAARVIECERAGASSNKRDRSIRDIISDVAKERQELWTRVVEYNEMGGSPEMSQPKDLKPEDLKGKMILAVQEWCPG